MNEQRIIQALHESAKQAIPADLDLWPAIRARLQPRRQPSPWAKLTPAARLGLALLILTLFLAMSAGVYAVAPILSRAFQMDDGLRYIEWAKLGQEVNLSQTVDGFTVTLQRVYADANRIVIGYTVSSPPGQRYANFHLTQARLIDDKGTVFSSGVIGVGAGVEAGTGGYVDSFDAAGVQGTPDVLHLRLVTNLDIIPLVTAQVSPIVTRKSEDPSVTIAEVLPQPKGPIIGPFTFDFSVAFIPGRVVQVQQTVEKSGIAVRLERVVVTPSETRAILCLKTPSGEPMHWTPIVGLAARGKSSHAGAISGGSEIGESGCYRYSVFFSYYDQPGEWTLTVKEVVDLTQPGKQTRLSGPWVFRFRVP